MRLTKNDPSKKNDEEFSFIPEPNIAYNPHAAANLGNDVIAGKKVTPMGASALPAAVIGPKISFKGELAGEEDLLIQGKVEGTIDLKGHHLTIGNQGVVRANLVAKTVTIEGTVEGDVYGEERISIKSSSNVKGNLIAERVTLEDGAKFRGSIDMDTESRSRNGQSVRYKADEASSLVATKTDD